MSETATEEVETEAQSVQMSLLGNVDGVAGDDGYRFAVTHALPQAGYTRSDVESGLEVRLSQPEEDASALTGVVMEMDDGRKRSKRHDPNRRGVLQTGGSLAITLSKAQLDALGVEYSEGDRPTLDVWAAEGVIAFTPVETRVIHVDTDLDPVRALPDVIEQDYRAIVLDGKDPEEWVEQRGLTPFEKASGIEDPEEYVKGNVEKAKELVERFEEQN